MRSYTDAFGTARYNQGLSVGRTEAVRAELVRDAVPTAQSVREPQNRWVEIVLR